MGNSQETDLVCKEMEKEVNSRFLFFSLKGNILPKKKPDKKKQKKKRGETMIPRYGFVFFFFLYFFVC